jgi:hypothetical protein
LKKGLKNKTFIGDTRNRPRKRVKPMNEKLLYQWTNEIAMHLPDLNTWQVENLGLFSYGVIQAESCQQDEVSRQVSGGEKVESTSRRWRRFLHNEHFPLETFFKDWSGWICQGVPTRQITLLVDETKLQDRIGVMMVGLAWQKRCLPLAWRTYRANSAAEYPTEGQVKMIHTLLQQVKAGLPSDIEVLVLADRGIGTSPELCRAVADLGWHYLFRVTCQTKIVTENGALTIAAQVQPGEIWAADGLIFKKRGRIPAQARALWEVGYDDPWALVTNDARLTGHEYARRNWQEQSFRDLKSGGWRWGDSRVRHPDHVARLLVILALAYAWIVALGTQALAQGRQKRPIRTQHGQYRRHWSVFKEGLCFFVEFVQRQTRSLGLVFLPDSGFT